MKDLGIPLNAIYCICTFHPDMGLNSKFYTEFYPLKYKIYTRPGNKINLQNLSVRDFPSMHFIVMRIKGGHLLFRSQRLNHKIWDFPTSAQTCW